MDNTKRSMLLYETEIRTLLSLPDEQCGKILRALLSYSVDEETPELDPMENALFTLIRAQTDRARDLSDKRRQAQRESAKSKANTDNPVASSRKTSQTLANTDNPVANADTYNRNRNRNHNHDHDRNHDVDVDHDVALAAQVAAPDGATTDNDAQPFAEAIDLFENRVAFPMSESQRAMFTDAYAQGLSPPLIAQAVQITIDNNAKWTYCRSILVSWASQRILTLDDWQRHEQTRAVKQSTSAHRMTAAEEAANYTAELKRLEKQYAQEGDYVYVEK